MPYIVFLRKVQILDQLRDWYFMGVWKPIMSGGPVGKREAAEVVKQFTGR